MTNDEIRRNDETRMTKPASAPLRVFRHSGFGFLSSFVVIQRLVQVRFMVSMHAKKRKGALHEPRSAAVPAASCGGVSPPARTPGGTPGALAGEDACATSAGQFMIPMRARICVRTAHDRPL